MTHTGWDLNDVQVKRLEKLFKQAAKSSMLLWRNGDSEGFEDLANELWVWALERKSVQGKLSSLNNNEIVALLKTAAQQLLSGEQHKLDLFRQSVLYSSDNVKEALKGKSSNSYLIEMLPDALKKLEARNGDYSAAIESRYLKKIVPPQGKEHVKLVRAIRSLTEIVNALCISTTHRDGEDNLRVKDGPGSKNGKFPQDGADNGQAPAPSRSKGEHSDPVARQALAIMAHPEIEADLLELEPITEYTKGPRRVITLPDGRLYRLSSKEQKRDVFKVMNEVLERLC